MQKIKTALRVLVITLLIILAFFGIGITGNFLNTHRERYMDPEIRTEQENKREDEGGAEQAKR
jgi:hypothetical protein